MTKPTAATAKTVDDYINGLPGDFKTVLEKLRQAILKAAPKAEEIISYQIPTYKYKGPLVHFAVFKDHCSLIVINKNILKTFGKELKEYKTTGTTIHFTPGKPLPSTLVQRIVKIRVTDNEEREAAKKPTNK
jgi:uncharacterized protein YdhG (YjbR/CyaY superfamily)